MKPKISIIIPFYNCQYVNKAILSALNQSYPNIEVIIVDDGSTQFAWKIKPFLNNHRIKYIKKQNKGTASALNVGIKNASGEYVAWLSSDDLFVKEKIQKQFQFMKRNSYQISYTNYSWMNEYGRITKEKVGIHYPRKKQFYSQLLKGCHINGCTVMMARKLINKIGLFDESLNYAQDFDYWLRAIQHFEFGYLNEPLTLYRVHSQMGTQKYKDAALYEANQVIKKYTPYLKDLIAMEK